MELETNTIRLDYCDSSGSLILRHRPSGQRLLVCPSPHLLQPVFEETADDIRLTRAETADANTFRFQYDGDNLDAFSVDLHAREIDVIDLTCRFTPKQDMRLARLDLFPAETLLNMYQAINFRNRHHTHATWPELLLGGAGCETDTYSADWQFAPHPTALLLQKLSLHLFCGLPDLAPTYGMYFKARDYRLEHWFLDYGGSDHGLALRAGEPFVSPTIRLFLIEADSPYQVYERFGRMLVAENRIPNPSGRTRFPWHEENLYCTWTDQCLASKSTIPADLKDQTAQPAIGAVEILTGDFVRRAASVIREKRLPFRTILIDDGWQVARGEWRPHPERFGDMRALVDELHAQDFKVVVWWNWAEIVEEVEVPQEQLAGEGRPNRHGRRMRDYSKPVTQVYLRDLFRFLFSHEDGCCDLDGVKTDFLADKVHADLPPEDPAWRGEANYFRRINELFFTEMRRHKTDAVHIGCAGHYHLADWIDINRTYDIHASNYREHEERARMLMATSPGVPVAYDFHGVLEHLDEYFASARDLQASIQIGNVLYIRKDLFSPVTPADQNYYRRLRSLLLQTGKGPA